MIRVAGTIKDSVVDGPGVRYVVFAQGCKHKCVGCHNPETQDLEGGELIEIEDLVKDIINNKQIDGVTFSGGDPFFQPKEFKILGKRLRENKINVLAYTGFIYDDIIKDKQGIELLENIDTLMDGPFIMSKKTYKMPFRGSSNQRFIDVKLSLKEGRTIEV